MTKASGHRCSSGFTLPEFLIFLLLGSVVAGALYRVVVFQQRIYRQENETVRRHDALRLAATVLAADLREASGREGDFAVIESDSVTLRSPVGFAIICAADSSDNTLALFDVSGRINSDPRDSLLIYHPTGWIVRAVQALNPSSASLLNCPYASGLSRDLTVSLDGPVGGIPVGAPVRAFRTFTYRLEQDRGEWWLARDDGVTTDILVGPFTGDGSGLSIAYFDSLGASTPDPTDVLRVDLTLVAQSGGTSSARDTLTASVRPRNQ